MTYSSDRGRWYSLSVGALVGAALILGGGACEDDEGTASDAGPSDAGAGDGSRSDSSDGGAGETTVDSGGDSGGDAAPAVTASTTCSIVKLGDPVAVAAGREVVCALDIGSNNAKLVVLSLVKGQPDTLKDERQCRNSLRLGSKTAPDTANPGGRALPQADIDNLVLVVKQFQEICSGDKGMLLGAEATQWARDASNRAAVVAAVKAGTTVDIEVLTPEQEGQYGYTAATYNRPKKLSLDPGSNSFQIGFWLDGETAARTVSVPFGYQRGADKYYPHTPLTETYEVIRKRHAEEIKTLLEAALGKLTPATNLAAIKAAISGAKLGPELYIVGQDGALHLSVRGALRDTAGKWIDTSSNYTDRVAMEKPAAMAGIPGLVTTVLTPAEISRFFSEIVKPADFDSLRSETVRDLYGEKALANAVLVDLLVTELGLTSVLLVPQEMPTGYVLGKLK
jgi:hypothetical protein